MPIVEVKNLTKNFGSVVAVKDVSFAIEERDFLILLGPSGCGKTTILRMIAGLEIPTSGEIFLRDRIEQMGEPKHVYKLPSTLFVADFIGSPTINKINGVVGKLLRPDGRKSGNIEVLCGDFSLLTSHTTLPEGKEVIPAIRPENITRVSAPGRNTLAAQVHTILPAGPETILQVTIGEMTLNILMTQETEVRVGDRIYVHFPPEHIVIFDADSQALLPVG